MKKSTFEVTVFYSLVMVCLVLVGLIAHNVARPKVRVVNVTPQVLPYDNSDKRTKAQWEADCKPVLVKDEFGTEMTACTDTSNPHDRYSGVRPTDTVISGVYNDYPIVREE